MENMEGVENFLARMNVDIKAIKTGAEQSALFFIFRLERR